MNIQIRISTSTPTTIPDKQLWRIPHDIERVNVDADDMRYRPNVGLGGRGVVRKTIREAGSARPEIYRCTPDHTTRIDSAHQFLWKNINPELSGTRWRTLLGNYLAWTNQSGFPGRADYVNGQDLDESLPNFHATLVNGGMIVEGEEGYSIMQAIKSGFRAIQETLMRKNSFLNLRKSFRATVTDSNIVIIKSLLISDPVPSAETLLKTYMWSYGTSVIPRDGSINMITRLGIDGTYKKVRIPFLTTKKVWLSKDELHKLQPGELPTPQWMFVE